MNNVTLADAANIILNENRSILIIDTCALLDIIRIPYRQRTPTTAVSCLNSAKKLSELSSEGLLKIIIPPLVKREFEDNIESVKDELKRHINKISTSIEILVALFINDLISHQLFDVLKIDFSKLLEQICDELFSIGLHIKEDQMLRIKATERSINNIPPARKGAVKDCIIYEHSLELASILRRKNFTKKIVFFTSNTKDYCDDSGNIKNKIYEEFSNFNIKLCSNWNWVLNEINNCPTKRYL